VLEPAIRDALLEQLAVDAHEGARHRIVQTLVGNVLGDDVVLDALIRKAMDTAETSAVVRMAASEGVVSVFPDQARAREAVEQALDSDLQPMRVRAAAVVVRASRDGDRAATQIVISHLDIAHSEVQTEFTSRASELIQAGDVHDLTDKLLAQLRDGDAAARQQAAQLLDSAGKVTDSEPAAAERSDADDRAARAREAIKAVSDEIDGFLAGADVTELERGFLADLIIDLSTLDDLVASGRFDVALQAEASRLERLGNSITAVATRPETVLIGTQLLSIAGTVKELMP
jgi:hypothetical protein